MGTCNTAGGALCDPTPHHSCTAEAVLICTMSPVLAHLVCAAVIKGQHKTYGVFVA